ncbi:hypothetical protein AB0G32_36375 [Streptomyces sp. NPDC023723]|uniref:hypothetical protein n=1 Tax=Streptomyces sp. NPDC023723 TaxID=3154323 RepID=UPI0033FDD615
MEIGSSFVADAESFVLLERIADFPKQDETAAQEVYVPLLVRAWSPHREYHRSSALHGSDGPAGVQHQYAKRSGLAWDVGGGPSEHR